MDESTFRQNFGITFRKIRKSKGLNQDQVAERAGLSTSYISDVERGAANPKLDTIAALAKGIGVDAIELFAFEKRVLTPDEIKSGLISFIQNENIENIDTLYHKVINFLSR